MKPIPAFKQPHVLSALLPPDARLSLARAAHEAKHTEDPLEREVIMEDAIARIRRQYPNFFKE
jgi:hypothetical protein